MTGPAVLRTPPPLTRAVARAVVVLLRRELAEDEARREAYGAGIGTPPRDVVDALDDLESALRLAGEVP